MSNWKLKAKVGNHGGGSSLYAENEDTGEVFEIPCRSLTVQTEVDKFTVAKAELFLAGLEVELDIEPYLVHQLKETGHIDTLEDKK